MNNEQSIFDLIEQYHLGLLSKEEVEKVELRIKTDASFADYVKFNGIANEIVYASGLDLLRGQMSSDLTKIEQKRTFRKWKIGAGIIGAIIGLIALIFIIRSNETKKPFTPGHNQNHEKTSSQIYQKEITTSESNSITVSEKIASNTSNIVYSKNEVKNVSDKNSTYIPIQNNGSSISEEITEPTEEIIKPENSRKNCTLSFDAIVQLTCKGEQNGSIHVESGYISGGIAPYSFQLSNTVQQSSTGIFSDLAKGNYIITITDSKACSASKEITVYEKNCTTKKSFSFNPDYGEKWEMQVGEGKSGSFTIHNRAGIIIRTNNFSQDGIEWDGTNALGSPAEMGVYMCTVHYTDGKTEIIELSIVR